MTPEQLKASILQYAIEGKLVKQDPNDEPASVLLDKIEAEKERLVKEGKIKKAKKLPAITDDEKPFSIPDSWEWVRLEDLSTFLNGFAYKSKNYVKLSNNQVIRLGNVKNNKLVLQTKPVYIDDKYATDTLRYQIRKNDILFTMTGTRRKRDYFFTLLIKPNNLRQKKLFLNQRVGCLRYVLCNPNWLNFILKAPTILDEVFANETGTANQGNIGSVKTMSILIPLPPLAEQKRIVAKIEKLMPLVDKYAEAYNRLQKIDTTFEEKLKQSILQYAMEGKLVPQNPNDKPVSVLLERIKAEKDKLVKEGKIKKSKALPQVEDDEKPFSIPDSWEWVRLGSILKPEKSVKPKFSFKYVDIASLDNKTNIIKGTRTLIYGKDKIPFRATKIISTGDILYSTVRPYLRNIAVVPSDYNNQIATSGFYVLKPLVRDTNLFLFYVLLSPYLTNAMHREMKGLNSPSIKKSDLSTFSIPLPPLEEQQRIVSKIQKIFNQIKNKS